MKASERLRKQMEEQGLLGTDAKKAKVIVNTTQKKAAEKSAPSLRSGGMAAKKLPQTELFKNITLPRAETKRQTQRQIQRARVNINTDRGFVPDSQLMRQLGRTGTTFQKSTAQDEKTRLYETNDSLLSPQEILKKYSYVVQDKDMDYGTLRRAVSKGMQEVGRTLRGTNDNSQYERVAKLQTELQGRLKSASFTAGLLEGMGGDGKDALIRLSGNEALQKQNEALKAQMEATQANHRGAATAGQLTGELAKAGAGYMTIGKAAENLALKGAGKLGQRMAAATAADGAQKLAARVLLDPKKAKAAGFTARMLAQQAADTAVNTPITIINGAAEGKSKKEILQDFGKQEAMDAAFNLGLAGLGVGAKMVADKAGTKIAMHNIPKQIEKSMTGQMASSDFIKLGKTPEILQKYGMIKGEMLMPQSVVPKVAYPAEYRKALAKGESISENQIKKIQGHNLGFEAIRQLPEKMKNPVAILKSDTQDGSIVVLTDMVDTHKNPIIVPVKVNQNGYSEFSSVVPSMYGKKDFLDFINNQREKGNILYLNKKKNLQHFPDNGVQFPESYSDADPMLRIAQRSGNVKEGELKNISKGNKLEQAEVASEQAIKETAAETGGIRQETIQGAAAGMAEKRNILAKRMSREEINALETEYANLQSAEYKAAKLQEVSDATGGDPAAIRNAQKELEDRKLEIEKTLTQQEALRTSDSIIKDVSDEVVGIFNLKGKKRKQQVQDALRRLIAEAEDGKISEERRNSLFEKLFQISGKSKTGVYGLKKRLREKKLILSVEGAADIPDISQWNRTLSGKMGKIKVSRDSNISAFYHELRKDFPAYFPEGIDREADQLRQMRKIAEKRQGEIGLEKSNYQENFNRALDRLTDALDVHTAYAAEVGKKAEGFQSNLLGKTDYGKVSTAEVEAWNKERWRLQEIADGVPNDLNETEKHWLEGMLNGDITEVQAKKATGPRYALIKQQYDVQKPLREIEEKINGHKQYVSAKKYNLAAETIGEMRMADGAQAGWKDKPTGFLYGRETQERNLRDIAPDKETADRIEQVYFAPIHENERQRTLLMKEYKGRLKKLKISTRKNIPIGIPGSGETRCSESALVQWLGESRYELQRMKAAGAAKESYLELENAINRIERGLHPNQLAKINDGIEQLRSIYEELHPMINEVLIRNGYDPIGYIPGYFPHMNFDDPTGPLETAAAKLGFDFSSKELPMDIAGRTEIFRPGKRWAGNFLQRTGTKTDYDALRAFDLYIDNISDVIYHTDDIRNLRSMEDYIRYSLSDEGIQKEIEAIRKDRSLMPEEKQAKLDEIYKTRMKDHKLQNYVNNLRTYTDLLAGKKHPIDRPLETQVFGRKAYKAINEIENRVAGNMVAANIGSALTNFIPITQGMSNMRLSSNLKGLGEALISMGRGEMDELTKKSAFLATREGTEQLYKTTMRKISDVAGKPMEWADKFSTQAVWRSRYYDNLAKGMAEEEAIKNADKFARGLFAGRSKGAMPTLFSAKAAKPLTMFNLEVNNTISYLTKDIPREAQGDVLKMMNAYGGLVIGAYIYNDMYEKLTGRRPALDPFGIANEAFGDLTGEKVRNTLDIIGDLVEGDGLQLTEKTEKKKGAEVYSGLKENIAENIPFIGGLMGGGRIPISSAFPDFDAIGEAKANYATGDITKERKNQIVRKEFGKSLAYMAMPVAGGQTKKTVEGLNMMRKGGNFTQTNKGERLQFAVDQDKKTNWVQAALFGKWAIPEAQAHMEKKRTLSEKNTETYKKLVEDGAKNTRAFETLSRMQMEEKDKEKRRVIRSSILSEEQKAILYHSITDEDSADRRILDHYQGTAHMGKAADCLMRMADYKDNKPKKYILQNTNLPDAEKKYIYLEKIVQKDDREKETKKIDALMGAGIGMNDYIDIKNKYAQINASKSKTMPDDMSRWLREKGFTWQQQAVIKEQFIFWGMHPKKYKN